VLRGEANEAGENFVGEETAAEREPQDRTCELEQAGIDQIVRDTIDRCARRLAKLRLKSVEIDTGIAAETEE
jgi:hypothetical protein